MIRLLFLILILVFIIQINKSFSKGKDDTPVDCEVNPWSEWSQCELDSTGKYSKSRNRTIKTEPKNGGKECPSLNEKEICTSIDCEVNPWSEWSQCEPDSTGKYSKSRNRTIKTEPIYGGQACPSLNEKEICTPIDCEVNPWSEWSQCEPDSTGNYVQSINRTIKTEPKYGGRPCPILKNEKICPPEDCVSSPYWSSWSSCNPETNKRTRTKIVIRPAKYGGEACPPTSEEKDCSLYTKEQFKQTGLGVYTGKIKTHEGVVDSLNNCAAECDSMNNCIGYMSKVVNNKFLCEYYNIDYPINGTTSYNSYDFYRNIPKYNTLKQEKQTEQQNKEAKLQNEINTIQKFSRSFDCNQDNKYTSNNFRVREHFQNQSQRYWVTDDEKDPKKYALVYPEGAMKRTHNFNGTIFEVDLSSVYVSCRTGRDKYLYAEVYERNNGGNNRMVKYGPELIFKDIPDPPPPSEEEQHTRIVNFHKKLSETNQVFDFSNGKCPNDYYMDIVSPSKFSWPNENITFWVSDDPNNPKKHKLENNITYDFYLRSGNRVYLSCSKIKENSSNLYLYAEAISNYVDDIIKYGPEKVVKV